MSRAFAVLFAGVVLFGAVAVRAAAPTPDHAGAFVAFCASHFADCKSRVVTVDVAAMAGQLYTDGAPPACAIPKGVDNVAATRSILAWMANQRGGGAMGTDEAIRAAMKAIWRCQLQVGDGVEAGGPPAKTGDFVAYCPTHTVKCANKMVSVMVTVMVPDPPKHCLPPHDIKSLDLSSAVLGWLGRHPETYGLDTDEGVMTAFDHLWPCR